MMPLYARNDVTLCKTCHILWIHIAAQGMYWRILLWKKHAEICLLILFSSLGCAVFPPMVSSNFLGWCPKTMRKETQAMRKSANNAHLDDVHEVRLSRHGHWLLSFGNISKNVHKTKQKLNQKTSLWPYVQTTHGPPLPSFVLSFDKLGQKLQKAWREQNTHTQRKTQDSKHKKHSTGVHKWLGHSFFLVCVCLI